MKFAADSSLIVRLYRNTGSSDESKVITEYLTDGRKVISVSDLVVIEVLNVLLRDSDGQGAGRFDADLGAGERLKLEPLRWTDAFRQAESLTRRFSSTFRPGGHDLMLVAAAVTMGATWFLSLDRNSRQRPLAAAAGLKVWPPLDREEKGLARLAVR